MHLKIARKNIPNDRYYSEFLKQHNKKYVNNYLNFSVNNFSILEHGSLVDVVEAASEQYELNDQRQNDGELL